MTDQKSKGLMLRFAKKEDSGLILAFIKELAEYEKMSDVVVAKEEDLAYYLFEKKLIEVIIGEYNQEPVAFALYFFNFSTFLGKPGLYLEDIYVKPSMRGKGIGRTILSYLAKIAKERDCGRMEWSCLKWNEPSIAFYTKLGAVPMDEWTVYRMQGQALNQLAMEFDDTVVL